MAQESALVKNAADHSQVKSASQIEKMQQQEWENVLRAQIATPEGRAFILGVMNHCGLDKTSWHPSALIHYNVALRDLISWLKEQMTLVDRMSFIKMLTEAEDRLARLERTKQAMHTKQATSQTGDSNVQA